MWVVETISRQCCELNDLTPVGKVVDRNVPRHVKCKVCGTQYINQPNGVITNSLTEKFGLGYSRYDPAKVYDLECYKQFDMSEYRAGIVALHDDYFTKSSFMAYMKSIETIKLKSTPIKTPLSYTPKYYSKWITDKDFDI